ncbi:6,7-dimethyl-8-ribityllumazine synthase [Lactobacillus delbrueckii subsp. bulgaricus]|nr:6,7-dimethyl-8-ribityllumazine synthase [Lactobacillus delbrueckii subsp. bulgaricus]
MAVIQSDFKQVHGKVAIVVSRFNELVTKSLATGADETLLKFGIKEEDIDTYWVPGAFELGFAAKKLVDSGKYDGIMTLGAVIKG